MIFRIVKNAKKNIVSIKTSVCNETLDYPAITWIAFIHILAIYAIFNPSIEGVMAFLFTHILITGFGLVIGFHRLFSHRQYKATTALRNILGLLGTLGMQGGPLSWVDIHREHHKYSDTARDPQSIQRGFFWSYCGWLFVKNPNGFLANRSNVQDMEKEQFLVFLNDHFIIVNSLFILLITVLFNFEISLWATVFRAAFTWHTFAWVLTSFAHMGKDNSGKQTVRNIPWMSFLMYGENLHKNHHEDAQAIDLSFQDNEFDPGYLFAKKIIQLDETIFKSEIYKQIQEVTANDK